MMNTNRIDSMFEEIKASYNPLNHGGVIECVFSSVGTLSEINTISEHMSTLGCKCRLMDTGAPEDRLWFWIAKDDNAGTNMVWGINAIYG